MAKGSTFANDLLKLIFNATAIADLAENDTSGPLTVLYISLHTADPGAGGGQTTSEIAYVTYARQSKNRASGAGGFTVTANSVSPADAITFPVMDSGTGGTVTHWMIGTVVSAAGKNLYSGTVAPNIAVTAGVTPSLTVASAVTES